MRRPVRNPELSRCYRRNFHTFVNPSRLARPGRELIRALPRETVRRVVFRERPARTRAPLEQFFAERADVYPNETALLQFNGEPRARSLRQPAATSR